jgi:hypothetical protein
MISGLSYRMIEQSGSHFWYFGRHELVGFVVVLELTQFGIGFFYFGFQT